MRKPPNAVVSRSIAAILAGYLISNLCALMIAILLPLPQIDAALTGMTLSFAIYSAAAIWAFTAKTAFRMWMGLTITASICVAILGAYYFWIDTPL